MSKSKVTVREEIIQERAIECADSVVVEKEVEISVITRKEKIVEVPQIQYSASENLTPNLDSEIFLDVIKIFVCEASHSHSDNPSPTHSHSHSHLILDPGSAYYDDAGGGSPLRA